MALTHLDQGILDALYTAFNLRFKDGLQKSTSLHKEMAEIVTSGTSIENYPILEQLPRMKEWFAERQINEMKVRTLTVKNRDFENSVRVSRNAIADEQTGLYGSQVAGLGKAAENIWDDLVFEALVSNSKWLDQYVFFSTARKYGEYPVVNTSAEKLSTSSYELARATMQSYMGSAGTPLNVVPDTLIVGPSLETIAKNIVEMQYVSLDGKLVQNPLYGTAKIILSTRLVGTHANKWYLMCTTDTIKPIVVQQRELPTLTRIDSPNSDHVFKFNENLYGTSARGAAALIVPHLIYAGLPTA